MVCRQSSFTDNEEKSRLAELVARVDLKKAEVQSAQQKLKNSKIYSNGGRVLNFVVKSNEFKISRDLLQFL